MNESNRPWYRELNRYHWFVFIVAALGWLFDTMDQQLFNLARVPAMQELLGKDGAPASPDAVNQFGPWATSIFLMGWATGGLLFGVLGDRFGRAKVMMWTILVYSVFTGISAFSTTFWDFALWRFLTGLGVGGEFAVGVALVAEIMPDRARPFALGLLQALSAVGNISAALISLGLGEYEDTLGIGSWALLGFKMTRWRIMFLIGTVPALLCIVIRQRLKEPERWQKASHDDAATKAWNLYQQLFADPLWRKRALLGMVLASAGVIGLWGIGFFAIDLNLSVFRKVFQQESRVAGEAVRDQALIQAVVADPALLSDKLAGLKSTDLLSLEPGQRDAAVVWDAIRDLHKQKDSKIDADAILGWLDKADPDKKREAQSAADRERRSAYLTAAVGESTDVEQHLERIGKRSKDLAKRVTRWGAITSLVLNFGAFFGIYGFSLLADKLGRRLSFAIAFVAAGVSTAFVFLRINSTNDVFWMIPIMGFCQLSLFGGYAIYFPELFPTRLRSTGTSFCYNVGRFIAAIGPFTLGALATRVFQNSPEPYRPAGALMCLVFLVGIAVLPFCPETKNQPLPE